MNRLVRKVLIKVILGLLITEPHKIRNRRRRTTTSDRVLGRNRLFRCHKKVNRERRKETEKHSKR